MGGILSPSKEEEIMKLLRLDDPKRLQTFLNNNQLSPELLYTKHKRTLLQLSCYYESPKCCSKLIEMNYDYNIIETENGNTPLFISCKFNCLPIVKILLAKEDCKKLVKNNENLNEFDIAFLKGNYPICYYLLYEYKDKNNINKDDDNDIDSNNEENNNIEKENDENIINTNINNEIKKTDKKNNYDINQIYQNYFFNNNFDIEYFLALQASNMYPLFNMDLFFKSLCAKIPPKDCGSFAPERKRTKELLTKIPDPNETWGHFFKRIANLELYNPPLVDKKNVSQMNSLYMNTQMKLIESEYGIKLNYYNPNTDKAGDDEDDEGTPIIRIKKKKNKNKFESKNPMNDDDIEDNDINKEETNNNEKEENKEKKEKKENICVLKVNDNSSERKINEDKKDEE